MGAAEIAEQPGVSTACRIAYELHGLSLGEWKWCHKEPRRVALLAPAVVMLGMGEDEMANADQAPWVPGDDAAEFTQACRLAYHSWQDDGTVSPIADPLSHPLFAVTAEQKAWCGAEENRSVLEWTAMRLGIETQGDAPFIERVTAYVRTCRVASIVREVPVHVRDGLRLFSLEVREQAELQLAEIERTTGFVGVFVTEQTTTRVLLESDTAPAGPDVRAYLEARYAGDESNDSCAMVYVLREPGTGPCCPAEDSLVPLFGSGQWDEGLNAFVSLVEEIAGDPKPPPRRLPDDPFREPLNRQVDTAADGA